MKRLSEQELEEVRGGFSFLIGAGIVAIIVFLVGVFDGYTRPIKCNR
ncbi:MAG: class IIb bacteriocin, lactobin A/cerein 7B family [Bacilli bacterium]|nr:class IIb bacteriocin, lactobin A/cerein 7B family [Bacilli bacterium]